MTDKKFLVKCYSKIKNLIKFNEFLNEMACVHTLDLSHYDCCTKFEAQLIIRYLSNSYGSYHRWVIYMILLSIISEHSISWIKYICAYMIRFC